MSSEGALTGAVRKYSYYPGCTAEGTSVEFDHTARAVCETVGIELIELEDWSCCGASSAHSLNHELSLSLPGRNVALAQKAGLDTVIPCPACYQNSMSADNVLREDGDHIDGCAELHVMPVGHPHQVMACGRFLGCRKSPFKFDTSVILIELIQLRQSS